VHGQIAVAECEEGALAERAHRVAALKGVAANAPALRFVDPPGERVRDGVEIGRDVKAPHLEVVAGVADDGELFGRYHRREPAQELRRSRSAGERDEFHDQRSLSAARNRNSAPFASFSYEPKRAAASSMASSGLGASSASLR
jgi:hypothetical protein